MMAQMQAKLVKDKQTNEKSETDVKADPNRAAILDKLLICQHPAAVQTNTTDPRRMSV
jgi:hypothetical protein